MTLFEKSSQEVGLFWWFIRGNTLAILLLIGVLLFVDYTNFKAIVSLRKENRILMTNNVNLIRLNEGLSQGLSDIANKFIEKAEWDKQVAEKIRDLDSQVKELYGQTNKIISETVR